MTKKYSIPATDVETAFIQSVVAKYHPKLVEAGVTWCILMVHPAKDDNGNPKGPALKLHGYPAHAVVRINSLEKRIEGLADVTLRIDADSWKDMSEAKRVATVDHECQHVEWTEEYDDANRPKLKMRMHDLVVGGFLGVIVRHQEDALELGHLKSSVSMVMPVLKQGTFQWG